MVFKHAYVLPIIVGIWYPLTFILTYIIAVLNKDVPPVFPYISDTGNWSPESCIFGILLNLGSILMGLTMYVRYRQIRDLCQKNNWKPFVGQWNQISYYMGLIASLGVVIVGNFQETNVFFVHVIGAIMAFGLGTIYQLMQTRISIFIFPTFGSKIVNTTRVVCTVISCVTYTITFGFAGLALQKYHGEDVTKWSKDDGGFLFHLISSIAEWILAFSTMLYFVLFSNEYKEIYFSEPEVTYKHP